MELPCTERSVQDHGVSPELPGCLGFGCGFGFGGLGDTRSSVKDNSYTYEHSEAEKAEHALHVCTLNRFSRVRFFVTPWTVARQAPLSVGFYRQD